MEESQVRDSGNSLPARKPTIIRPASKLFTNPDEPPPLPSTEPPAPPNRPPPPSQRPHTEQAKSPAHTEPAKPPLLLQHSLNEQVKQDLPPRPQSFVAGSVTSNRSSAAPQVNKRKVEITIVDARPISELGFRDMKGGGVSPVSPPSALAAQHPLTSAGVSDQDKLVKNELDGGGRATDKSQAAPVKVSHGAGSTQLSQDAGEAEEDQGRSTNPLRPPKPTIILPHSRKQSAEAQEEKLKPAPPVRPASTPRSNLPSSADQETCPQQPSQSQTSEPGVADTRAPAPKPRLAASPAAPRLPKRPPDPPRSSSHGSLKSTDQTDYNSHSTSSAADLGKAGSNMGGDSHGEGLENGKVIPKPRPKPKPRPGANVESKAETAEELTIYSKIEQIKHTNPSSQNTSHIKDDETILRKNTESALSTDESKRISQGSSDSSKDKNKRLTKTFLARFESAAETKSELKKSEEAKILLQSESEKRKASQQEGGDKRPNVPSVAVKQDVSHENKLQETRDTPAVSHPPPTHDPPPLLPHTTSASHPPPAHDPPALLPHTTPTFYPPPAHDPPALPPVSTASKDTQKHPSQTPAAESTKAPPPRKPKGPPRPTTSVPPRTKSTVYSENLSQANERSINLSRKIEAEISQVTQSASTRVQPKAELPLLPGRPGPGHPLYQYMARQPHGIASHDYAARQPDELSFSKGDVVVLVKEIDNEWMIGRVGSNEGMYPKTFTNIICPLVAQKPEANTDKFAQNKTDPQMSAGPRCRARFDFEGEGDGELTLEDGEVVKIIDRVGTEWLRGEQRGRQGIFPTSFVEIIEDLPAGGSTGDHLRAQEVTALFDFAGKAGELTFKKGDSITVLSQVNTEWLFGEHRGQTGSFPASFVDRIPQSLPEYKKDNSQDSRTHSRKQEASKNHKSQAVSIPADEFCSSRGVQQNNLGYCRAMRDYTDGSLGDLEFKKGERIAILEFLGEHYANGQIGNRVGVFPLHLVAEELNSPPPSPEPVVVKKFRGQVMHDFAGETVDDLTIKEGDIIEVEEGFADVGNNWRWGTLNGQRGMFPTAFVQILD